MKEIEHMQKEVGFEPNSDEDELRQIPEIVLREHAPELYRSMWFVVQTVLNPIFNAVWQRDCKDPASIQIANYNLKDYYRFRHHQDSDLVLDIENSDLQFSRN